ncbi:MAG: TonB-dependent receptor [candidate division Zixibacteria bacterium]|nr:TonB-dependent receptor [candidate division Zixibacteria bacterium]
MKRLPLALALFFIFSNCAFPYEIQGQLVDPLGNPVSGALVKLINLDHAARSDDIGNFKLIIPDDVLPVIKIKASSFEDKVVRIDSRMERRNLRIELNPLLYKFGGIIVTASRSEGTTFQQSTPTMVIKRREIEFYNPSTTAEILRHQPLLEMQKTSHSGGAPIIRGMFGKRVLTLADGIRLNNSTFRTGTSPYINTIPSAGIVRMEVVEGPSSVMYGSDALGGVVNIISEPQVSTQPGWDVSTAYSSADDGLIFNYSSIIGLGPGTLSIGVDRRDIGDLEGGGDIAEQSPSGWKDLDGSAYLKYPLNDRLLLHSSFQFYDADNIPRYDRYQVGDYEFYVYDPRQRFLGMARLDDEEGILGLDDNSYTISYQLQNEGRSYRKTGSDKRTEQEVSVGTYQMAFAGSKEWSDVIKSRFGGELYVDEVESWRKEFLPDEVRGADPSIPDGSKYTSAGIYYLQEINPGSRFELNPSLRYNFIRAQFPLSEPFGEQDETYSDFSFSLGMLYKLHKSVNLVGTFSKGFRAPNLDDLTKLEASSAGYEVPSPDLSSESSYNIDLGAKWISSFTEGEFSLWYARLEDFINRRPGNYKGLDYWDANDNGVRDDNEQNILVKVNSDRFNMAGFRYYTTFKINNIWSAHSSASFVWGEDADTGEPMSKIPPLMASLSARYNAGIIERAEIYAEFAARQDRLSELDKDDYRFNPDGTPAWATLNFRIEFNINDKFYPSLAVENIFDAGYKRHASGIYSPGSNLILGLRARF